MDQPMDLLNIAIYRMVSSAQLMYIYIYMFVFFNLQIKILIHSEVNLIIHSFWSLDGALAEDVERLRVSILKMNF